MSHSLKIGIIGSRGIPNHYGGFEQCAEYLSAGLVKKGHMVCVYNSHNHPYQQNTWNGVQIIHCFDPEYLLGTAGQFIYDFNCIHDAKKRKFDIILMLGYTSSSIWGRLYPGKSVIITNMDGLEWKRSKYSKPVRHFLKYAEKLAVKHSDFFIADSPVIQEYLQTKYNINSKYIAYGAELSSPGDEEILKSYNILRRKYFLLMARIEPENNIDTIPEGLQKTITENGKNISGGQQQRIIIARALYKDADLIILDEPFNELDEESEISILKKLQGMTQNGKTVILITHNKGSLSFCTKIVSLDAEK